MGAEAARYSLSQAICSTQIITDMNLYDVLCVKPSATQDEIKRNFHKAAHTHHPDKGGDEAIFKKISAAYAILSDPGKRAQYDAQIGIMHSAGGGFGGLHHTMTYGHVNVVFTTDFGGQHSSESFTVNAQNVEDLFKRFRWDLNHD